MSETITNVATSPGQKNRRSIILINPKFQLLFCFYVSSWIFALSSFYPVIIYNLYGQIIDMAVQYGAPEAAKLGAESSRSMMLWMLIILEILFIAVVFLISLFVSHRIAGPLYKLSLFFDKARAGDFVSKLIFRKKDHFQELAQDYNDLIASFKERIQAKDDALKLAIDALEKANQLEKANEIKMSLEPEQTQS
jgi:methyl-accepting chemotaxis protein